MYFYEVATGILMDVYIALCSNQTKYNNILKYLSLIVVETVKILSSGFLSDYSAYYCYL